MITCNMLFDTLLHGCFLTPQRIFLHSITLNVFSNFFPTTVLNCLRYEEKTLTVSTFQISTIFLNSSFKLHDEVFQVLDGNKNLMKMNQEKLSKIAIYLLKRRFKALLIFGNRRNSHRAMSGEYGCMST